MREEKADPDGPEYQASAPAERTKSPVRGIIERIRALEHPEARKQDDAISALKPELARLSSELAHLNYRYEARGEELNSLKTRYAELEHMFQMRPDAMRRAGEMDVTELVKKKHDLAELELSLGKERTELANEKEKFAAESRARLEGRLAELETEYSARAAILDGREEKTALREKTAAEAEKHLREQVEEARRRAIEELSASFARERASLESAFRQERSILSDEAEKWRQKAEETMAQLAEARKVSGNLEKELEAARESSAAAEQRSRLAEMESAALSKCLAEWEKKSEEINAWRSELTAREEKCRGIEEAARREDRTLGERLAVLEKEYETKRKALDETKAMMRAEIDGLVEKYRRERK